MAKHPGKIKDYGVKTCMMICPRREGGNREKYCLESLESTLTGNKIKVVG